MATPTTSPAPRRRWTRLLTAERPRPEGIRSRPGSWWLAVGTVCFGAFMGQLDASIVTLTYGSLGAEFHTSLAAVEWVSLAYLLTLVALLVPAGRLADAYGRKLLYLYGFAVFTLASAACGLAPSLLALVAFRVVQAAGAALMQANSVALVTTSAPRERMRSALGVQAAAQALGLALGPTVGGALVSTLGWRWVFWVNVPVGLVALVSGHYLLPRTRARTAVARFDWAGLALLATATTSALMGVSAASGLAVPGWGAVLLFAVAAGTGRAFVRRQRRAAAPLLDLALLRRRAVASGLLGALSGYLVLFGPLVLVPVVLTARGASELTAGLVLTALPAGFALAATGGDRLLPSGLPDRGRCLAGSVVFTLALAALLVVPLTAGGLVPVLVLTGVGLGTFTPANNAMIMGAIPARSSGTGGGLVNMTRGLGTALGVALVTLALHLVGGGAQAGARWAAAVLVAASAVAVASAWLSPSGERAAA
ncbi:MULTISPECIES: MFS transporter [unclassified Streptomyces]|uniref:MFS transporter n=1 Tax=unclassified Streptomyces TaxID=2593676 RepID=UPI001F037DAC|nr:MULTISPECIES: MFS transporter [unclassified Streptomyces]MCH0563022.1 MFS transporter [Streptomyces sp. MUM 2J]MCH0571982.1 MFS transporter [Streptomyces sp. MUM 136J]